MKKVMSLVSLIILFMLIFCNSDLHADGKNENHLLSPFGVYDLQQSTVSNISFYLTNYGIFGYNVKAGDGGLFWPRGSLNQYLFASGLWFGCQKYSKVGATKKLVTLSYFPEDGKSEWAPGLIKDGMAVREDKLKEHALYISTNFQNDGESLFTNDYNNWPLWVTDKSKKYRLGEYAYIYEPDTSKRNLKYHPLGPLFVSGEDFFSVMKDTDISRYRRNNDSLISEGYPIGLQIYSRIYSWGYGVYKNLIVLHYKVVNESKDTLYNCFLGGIFDPDMGRVPNTAFAAGNDRCRFFHENESLNLAVAWTNTDRGEKGYGFGYMGIMLLESPAIKLSKYLRNDKEFYQENEQIGLNTLKIFSVTDYGDYEQLYDIATSGVKDGDTGPSDKRLLLSTGTFHLLPGESTNVAFGIICTSAALGGEADGSTDDIKDAQKPFQQYTLYGDAVFLKDLYYNKISSVGVDNNDGIGNDFQIYPNPANDFITINGYDADSEKNKFEIFTVTGIKVIESNTNTIYVGNLAKGVYYFKAKGKVFQFIKL